MAENRPPALRRVTRSKAEARAAYDRMSRWYPLLAGSWEQGLRNMALRTLHVAAGEWVLEIGSGPGQDLRGLAQAVGPGGWVCGVDLSSQMARLARARAAKAGLASRVDLAQGDAERLPLAAGTMDAVLMSFTLELFDTPAIPLVLAEVQRVLRLGGRLCVVSLSKAGPASRMRDLYEWGHDRFPNLLDCRPIFVRANVEAAGFEILDAALESLFGLPVEIVLGSRVA